MRHITLLLKFRNYLKEKKYLKKLNPFFKHSKNISIISWYGGFGNNLIQIANSIVYSKHFKKNLYIPIHGLLNPSKIDQLNSHNSIYSLKSTFFYNNFQDLSYKDYYQSQINNIFKTHVFDLIEFYKEINLKDNELVIHLRPMITVENKTYKYIEHKDYLQNPLNYYLKLIEQYDHTTIVTENIFSNPLLPVLSEYDNVKIQSGTVAEDFNYLLNAKNLVLSTNSTFSITAALISKNLEKFYYSSLNRDNMLVRAVQCNEKYEIILGNYIERNEDLDLYTIFHKLLSKDVSINIKKVNS
jgi:hypothetical protein